MSQCLPRRMAHTHRTTIINSVGYCVVFLFGWLFFLQLEPGAAFSKCPFIQLSNGRLCCDPSTGFLSATILPPPALSTTSSPPASILHPPLRPSLEYSLALRLSRVNIHNFLSCHLLHKTISWWRERASFRGTRAVFTAGEYWKENGVLF